MRSLISAVQQVNEELQQAARNNDVEAVQRAIEATRPRFSVPKSTVSPHF